jgi:hypothetical protein
MRLPFDNSYPVTQNFGENPDMYAPYGLKGHNGIDFGLPTGTPVLAPHGGKIIEAALDPTGYGNYVKIEDAKQGSVLGHMQSLSVNVGDVIQEGQQVGISDNTGNSTGPHLHWGYHLFPRDRANGYNGFIDQSSYLATNNTSNPTGNAITDFLVSVGYSYPANHLEVIKAMYESDQKMKSGKYMLSEDCNASCNKKLEEANSQCETQKKAAVADAVNKTETEFKTKYKVDELQATVADYEKVKNSASYKIALAIEELLTHKS